MSESMLRNEYLSIDLDKPFLPGGDLYPAGIIE